MVKMKLVDVRVYFESEDGETFRATVMPDGEIDHDDEFTFNARESLLLAMVAAAVDNVREAA
jgi:hypothetical protein